MVGYFKTAPKEDEVLLTEKGIRALIDKAEEEYADVDMTDVEWEMKRWMIITEAQLTKAREAVEGAGLTEEEINTAEMPCDEDSRNCPIDTTNSYDQTNAACQLCSHRITTQAQTKAALKALGGE